MTVVWMIGVALAASGQQAASGQKPQMVEDVFKNVQVLKGIPVDEFMGTMGLFSAALSMCCAECHDTAKWDADTPRKRIARRMVEMVNGINRTSFGGRQVVTCWTCHRGRDRPVVTQNVHCVCGTPPRAPDDTPPALASLPG